MERAITREEQDILMFGVSAEALKESKPPFVSNLMYAMMILSDAQHVAEFDDKEKCRLFINRAKYFITNEMDRERELGVYER